MKRQIAIPNSLIFNHALTPSAKRVALALLSYHWERHGGKITKTVRFIAERAKVSPTTACAALKQLQEAGYITIQKNYRYLEAAERVVYSAFTYRWTTKKEAYTLIPYTTARRLLASSATHAAVTVVLYLVCRQGQQNSHAWPSLRQAVRDIDLAKSTICIAVLSVAGEFLDKKHCENRRGSYSHNCYFVIVRLTRAGFEGGSGIISGTLPYNNITVGSILRAEEIEGVPEFVILHETDASRVFEAETVFGADRDIMPFWLPDPAGPEGSQGDSCP